MLYVGTGISGGEIGALTGPSVMPGGSPAAWPLVKDLLQGIAAKLDDGTPCCEWIGSGGAGHYVKMVHNGIEYGDMQLIAESYFMLRKYGQLENDEIADIFAGWNKGELNSYLIGITADICRVRDTDGGYLLDRILDIAGQKGTGKWTAEAALEESDPLTLITEAVHARFRRIDGKGHSTGTGDPDEALSGVARILIVVHLCRNSCIVGQSQVLALRGEQRFICRH